MRWIVIVNSSYSYGPFASMNKANEWVAYNITDGSDYKIVQFINVTTN